MTIKEERTMILTMIAEGKITAEEGDKLLQALEKSEENIQAAASKSAAGCGVPGAPGVPGVPRVPGVPGVRPVQPVQPLHADPVLMPMAD